MPVESDTHITTVPAMPRKLRLAGPYLLIFAALVFVAGCKSSPELNANGEPTLVRIAYFPNITHAQAMIGMARGDFQKAAGDDVQVVAQTFNAGPAVIEALYAGHVDIAYVGPTPALNGFIQSGGEEIRVLAGSALNGVSVLGSTKRNITNLKQLENGRIATPQYGNTQDISARYFLGIELGFAISTGRNGMQIIPAANPDIDTLFTKDEIDAAWIAEPWASRMIHRGNAREILQEKDLWPNGSFAMTCVISRRDFAEKHPALLTRLLSAHIQLTQELQTDHEQFHELLNDEIRRITSRAIEPEVISSSMPKIQFANEIHRESFQRFFEMGQAVGIYDDYPFEVDRLIDSAPLQAALASSTSTISTQVPSHTTETLSTEGNSSNE